MINSHKFKVGETVVYVGSNKAYAGTDVVIDDLLGKYIIWDYEVLAYDNANLLLSAVKNFI